MRLIQVAKSPAETYHRLIARLKARNETGWNCTSDSRWRELLGVTVENIQQTQEVWRSIFAILERRGIRAGPQSFLGNNDADPAIVDAVLCLLRRTNASKVVETGVANGVSSRFILEWFANNNPNGHLWSVDLPPLDQKVAERIGSVVTDRSHWSLIEGSSRRRLPRLLKQIAPIDLFIHDSDHRYDNVAFEMRLAWDALRPGGAMVVDDIDVNMAFRDFMANIDAEVIIGEAEPIRPDLRRFNQKGMFGVIIKPEHKS
jgi:predicted O-methyltransferase YrrM